MAFTDIENMKVVIGPGSCSALGVLVRPRKFTAKMGLRRWIQILVGKDLASKLALTRPQQMVRLLFGSGVDAGTLLLAADQAAGKFQATRDKQGRYSLTLTAATAEGLFALEFAPFSVIEPEVLRAPGCAPSVCFAASAEMLACGD